MASTFGSYLSAQDVITLKVELLRRNQLDDIFQYDGSFYDFSTNPQQDHSTSYEYIDKILLPLKAVNEDTVFSIYEPTYRGRKI